MSIHQYSKHLSKDIPDYKSKLCNNVEHDAIYKVDFDEILTTSDILTMEINGVNMCFSKEDVKEMLKNNKNLLTNEKLGEFEKSVMNLFLSSLYYYTLIPEAFLYEDDLSIIFDRRKIGTSPHGNEDDEDSDGLFKGDSDFIFQSFFHSKTRIDHIENRKTLDKFLDFIKNKFYDDIKFKFYGNFFKDDNEYAGVCIIEYKKYKSPVITIYYDKNAKDNDINFSQYNKMANIYKTTDYRRYEKFSETFINKIDINKIEDEIKTFETNKSENN
jgi:hypothetical protein